MTATSKLREKAEESGLRQQAKAEGQMRFLRNVMDWEHCSMEEAMDICTGQTDPVQWEYTLGYKLADPIWSLGIFNQVRRSDREKASENFRKLLTPEEDELFLQYCQGKKGSDVRKQMKQEIKDAKKREKA